MTMCERLRVMPKVTMAIIEGVHTRMLAMGIRMTRSIPIKMISTSVATEVRGYDLEGAARISNVGDANQHCPSKPATPHTVMEVPP